MIDPKQGPLSRPGRSAMHSQSARNLHPEPSAADPVSETEGSRKQPLKSRRQFSLVGS